MKEKLVLPVAVCGVKELDLIGYDQGAIVLAMTEEQVKKGIELLRAPVLTKPPWAAFRCTLLMTEFEAAVVLERMEKFFRMNPQK